MANILIAWEFGAGFGHLRHHHPFIESLIEKGHVVTLVSKDIDVLRLFDFPESLKILPCPSINDSEMKPEVIACIASIWMSKGYSDSEKLRTLINCWKNIFDLTQPDLILFDFAPTALLAARDYEVKKVVIGSGFSELEPEIPCQVLSPWVHNIDEIVSKHESYVVAVINKLLIDKNDSIQYLGDLFDVDLTLLTTIPELDFYQRNLKNTIYLRPENILFQSHEVQWENNGRPKVFVYLKAYANSTKIIVNALLSLELDVIFCCPGLNERLINRFHRESFQVFRHSVHLEPLLQSAALIINHAGKGLVTEALLAGIPQLLSPFQIEQGITSEMLEKLGVGLTLPRVVTIHQTKKIIRSLIEQPAYAKAARRVSDDYDGSSKLSSYQHAVDRVLALIKT